MDQAALMHSAERSRERDRDAQELRELQRSAKQSIERHTAGILKHQRHAFSSHNSIPELVLHTEAAALFTLCQ
jgi:hypothetical protein